MHIRTVDLIDSLKISVKISGTDVQITMTKMLNVMGHLDKIDLLCLKVSIKYRALTSISIKRIMHLLKCLKVIKKGRLWNASRFLNNVMPIMRNAIKKRDYVFKLCTIMNDKNT